MEYFRWILVAVGVLILLGIVLFANPERKQSMTKRSRKDSKSATERREPVLDMDEDLYLARQQTIDGLNAEDEAENKDQAPASAPAADAAATSSEYNKKAASSEHPTQSASARQPAAANTEARPARSASGTDSVEQLFKNNVFSLYIVAERREPIAGVELLNAALKVGLDFGEHNIFHRIHAETGESVFSMANLTAPGSFDPTAWNLFETRGVSLFMPLPGPLGAMNGWDTMLAAAERLSSLLSARVVNASREPLNRQAVAQIREHMRQIDRRRQ